MTEENQSASDDRSVNSDMLAKAAQILGLGFTAEECQQMLAIVQERRQHYDSLRRIKLENDISPSFYFNPVVEQATPAVDCPRQFVVRDIPDLKRPDHLEDVAFYPVTHLAQLVRTRQVSSVELTALYLDRLRRYDPVLQCVVTLTEDLALTQAKRADAEIAAGHYRGPLHGIPWGAKDLLATRDYQTTWGAAPFRDQMIDEDATVVQRLEEAGAVLVAKLTLGALAYGDVWFGGVTKNPWDTSEGSSGSSAGSSAATAAGLVGFAIGTETLGSIVSPSTRCGATGLRPTFGRVSRQGAMALSWTMDKIGPICRTVEDCALVLTAIYGPDGLDRTVSDAPFVWEPDRRMADLRIGYVAGAFADADEETNPHDGAVLDVLRGLGVELVPITLPEYDVDVLKITLFAEAAAAFDDLTRSDQDDLLTRQDDDAWPNLFRAARLIPAVEYIQANRVRRLLMQAMAAIMKTVDVFVSPSFGGDVLALTNLTGHPAVVVPNGFTEKGTPTSISFIGGLYKEAETLTVAKAYQDATDYHLQYPPLTIEKRSS